MVTLQRNLSLLICLIFAMPLIAQEQPENAGFESWIGIPSHPVGWATQQSVSGINGVLETQDLSNSHSGLSSLKIKTDTVTIQGFGTLLVNGNVWCGSGSFSTDPTPSIQAFGVPFSSRPDSLVFWYKYQPVLGDSGNFDLRLTKWAGSQQVIGVYSYANFISGTNGNWNRHSCPIQYYSTDIPDSLLIAFSSSGESIHQGSTLWIDDVSLVYNDVVGWIENSPVNMELSLFPNPASTNLRYAVPGVNLRLVEVYNALGRLIMSEIPTTNSLEISSLENGCYFLKLTDMDGVIHEGEFLVSR